MAPGRKKTKDMSKKELKEYIGFKGLAQGKNLRRIAEQLEEGMITRRAATDILRNNIVLTRAKLDGLLMQARWEKRGEEALVKMRGWKELIEVMPKYQKAHEMLEAEQKKMSAAWKEYNELRQEHKNPHAHVVETAWKKVEESSKRFNEAWETVKKMDKEAEGARKHI